MGTPQHSSSPELPATSGSTASTPAVRIAAPMESSNARASERNDNRSTVRNGASKQGGRLSADSIGWYLSNIGRVPLLTPAEEIELAHHVQAMKRLQELPAEQLTPRQKHQIRMGTRARDRMMAANLRLVVSVAKKIGRAHV